MALMEDTGWYLPNYEMAEELKWGAGLGCDFALKSCKEWMDTRQRAGKSIHPYCNKGYTCRDVIDMVAILKQEL